MTTTLDLILDQYEFQSKSYDKHILADVPRQMTQEEWNLLNEHVNGDNPNAIHDYYDLKVKLDKEWVMGQMYHKHNPFG